MIDILVLVASLGIAAWIVYFLKRQAQAAVLTAVIEVHQSYARLMLGESDINELKSKVLEANEQAIRDLMDLAKG